MKTNRQTHTETDRNIQGEEDRQRRRQTDTKADQRWTETGIETMTDRDGDQQRQRWTETKTDRNRQRRGPIYMWKFNQINRRMSCALMTETKKNRKKDGQRERIKYMKNRYKDGQSHRQRQMD